MMLIRHVWKELRSRPYRAAPAMHHGLEHLMTRTSNAVDIMLKRVAHDPKKYASATLAVLAGRTASKLIQHRLVAGLSQSELAEKMSVDPSVVFSMESGDGHSLKMLNKAAIALGKRLVIEFEDK
jgi:ribosome-binding protein aMBF1 (putative translation factor)